MIKNEIATARAVVVKSVEDVRNQLKNFKKPYVLKADGLAAGKGVFISSSEEETIESAKKIFEQKILGSAGDSALLEEPLIGHEISAFVLVGDSGYRILPFFKDHKRLQENDLGPNTGGMGVIGPVTMDAELEKKIIQKVVEPSVMGIRKNNWTYRGLLYIGLMIVDGEPLVLEYNVRFGDPEAQCILPLLDGDWAQVLAELSKGEVPEIDWKSLYACCVVLAAPGYPDNPLRGEKILGDLHRSNSEGYLLHAGTKKQDSNWVSNGGRVLNAIGLGQNQTEAIKNAYKIVDDVHWPKKVYRRDIGNKL